MITKAMCEKRALELRVRAFRIIEDRERRYRGSWIGFDSYPPWAREMDKQTGDLFAQADEFIRLANGPAWRRWFR